jgi:argininosuccinate lyase
MPLWSGRFSSKLDPRAWQLNSSLNFDQRLALQDVRGSIAWVQSLENVGVLTEAEARQLRAGLDQITAEFEQERFVYLDDDEDIHSAVERRLKEVIGPLGGKLHTGRSRNDQVATDFRLWILDSMPQLAAAISTLQTALLECAERDLGILMPGYTHFQRAQPVLLSHWWLSHFWPLHRDRQRLQDLQERTAILPLGSGALAGAPFPIDREQIARALGFSAPCPNSIDGVSDRDFAAEFLFTAALCGIHASRLAEALILFASSEFGFIELSDAFSTGSSLMPQKKNPDMFELARGKAGTLTGLLTGFLITLKGLPSAYDKDLQEDKQAVFAAYDTLVLLLPVLAGAIETLTLHPTQMRQALDASMMATDLADYLVERGIPFRDAHNLAGQAVQRALAAGISLDAMTLKEYQQISTAIEADIFTVFEPQTSVERRSAIGGTAPLAVQAQIQQARAAL